MTTENMEHEIASLRDQVSHETDADDTHGLTHLELADPYRVDRYRPYGREGRLLHR